MYHGALTVIPLVGLLTLLEEVHVDSDQDYHTFHDVLPEGVDSQQIETIAQNTDNQSSDHRTANLTDTATHTRSTEYYGSNSIHLSSLTCSRLTAEHTGSEYDTGNRRHETTEQVCEEENPTVLDAAELCSSRVTTHCIDMPTQFRFGHDQHRCRHDDHQVDDRHGDLSNVSRTDEVERIGHDSDRLSSGIDI